MEEKIAFEVDTQDFYTEGFRYPHQECKLTSKRFGTFSDAICAAMPLVAEHDDVIISIVTFRPDKPGHTTTVAIYDFLRGSYRHAALDMAHEGVSDEGRA